MKPQRDFVAERPVANHCAQLLRSGPGAAELLASLERAGTRLARLLPSALYPLLGAAPEIESAKPRQESFADFAEFHPLLAANTLLGAGPQGAPVLATTDAGTILSLVDRAFGGSGTAPAEMPRAFALSAELMVARLDGIVADRLAAALGAGPDAVRVSRRDGSLTELAPFAPATDLATLKLEVREQGRAPWTITLAFAFATLADLFGHGERPPAAAGRRAPARPDEAPFADIPLPLGAVLVDMTLPLSTLSSLEVGQVLPVAVARAVPLRAGAATVARGTLGAADDRVAIQITQLS